MSRISDLDLVDDSEETGEVENESELVDEKGRSSHEVIADRFSDLLEDEEVEDDQEYQDSYEDEEEPDDTTADDDSEEEAEEEDISDEETDEEQEDEEEEEPAPTKDYSAIADKLVGVVGEEELQSPEQVESAIDKLVETSNLYQRDKQAFEAVTNLFDQSDDMVQLAKYVKEGYTVNEAIAAVIDFEEWQKELKEEDPEEYKKVVKRQLEREQRLEREKEAADARAKKIEDNKKASTTNWQNFKKQKGIGEDQADEFSAKVGTHFENIAEGRITEDFLDLMYKGLNFEEELKKAKEEGLKDGKNANINEVKSKKTKQKGDGLPGLKGGGAKRTKTNEPDEDDPFNLAFQPRKRLADI